MTSLINIAAILVFAFLVVAIVMVALRFLIPSEPYRSKGAERSAVITARNVALDVVCLLAVLALVGLSIEIRLAYGAPFGSRDPQTVEVIEVGDCERAPLGFGIARACELSAYRYVDADENSAPWPQSIEVVSGDPVRPGDLVARYSSAGWKDFLLLGSGGSRWQPVSAVNRPSMVWLPSATLIAATMLTAALRRTRRRIPAQSSTGQGSAEPA
ncbi:hypothetical protein O1R50_03660 [Glycomyces luteolus]|uniref:Uncharacterized protein n=1 Tax=Glycomyces luteolus TaxID=2670330 RepID=A0A9X3P888_9ACTN|nr:hypothetical protein [Glycomyces luteolus]MDA1358703.1 hypothetical protein [Glycomyces luteolus]